MSEIPAEAVQAAEALAAHRWADYPQSAHRRHGYDSGCAVCRGDVSAIVGVVVAAFAEQGYAVVPAEDLRIVSSPRSPVLPDEITAHLDARARLRAVLSGTAPQPSETPQDAQTGDGGIRGRSDTPGASTGLSAPHADDLSKLIDEMSPEEKILVLEYFSANREELLFAAQKAKARYERADYYRSDQMADLRRRCAAALLSKDSESWGSGMFDGDRDHALAVADVVLAVRDTELEQLRAALHTYENTITWFTTCHGCAKTLDSSYAETVRAEKAEAALVHAKALHSRDDSNPHGPWCGTCTTHWPCRTWIALLSAEEQTGDGRG